MNKRLSIESQDTFGSNASDNINQAFINDGKIGYEVIKNKKQQQKTMIIMDDLNDKIVKTMTGFSSLVGMLGFIIIVTNGEYNKLETTVSQLTWIQEWLVYLECAWCKSCVRWVDLALRYKAPIVSLREIFDFKTAMVKTCVLDTWPRFVTFDEDISMRKDKWNDYYHGKRIIMWDNTNINMCFKPSVFETQRSTYSQYYGGNVAKGGVFIQPCGWIGSHELWVGSISDSEYMIRSKVLQIQQTYLETYDNQHNVPFTVILDKGYRITAAAWGVGNTFVLQPSFARSDFKFTGFETIRNSAIASDRAANERAVRLCKLSGYIRIGLLQNESTIRLSDIWLTWSFQCNFNYKPVL
jgi:DDE superfamily endonuclease